MSPKKYTFDFLCNFINKEILIDINENTKLNSESYIKFKCKCENEGIKSFRNLVKNNIILCKNCTIKVGHENFKKTMIKNHGVQYSLQSKKIKNKIKQTFIKKYGVEHNSQLEDHNEKVKQTCIEKYGVGHIMQLKETIEKRKETCIEKYGVENSMQLKETIEKRKETCIKKYGVENNSQLEDHKEKVKQTCIEKYGVEHYSQLDIFKEKVKQTCIKKYGVEYPAQNSDIADKTSKNSYKRKEILKTNGEKIYLQGYEPQAYKILLEKYTEDEIITSNKLKFEIWWKDNTDKKHRYYPDFYIPKDSLIVEVKSQRTYSLDDKKEKIKKTMNVVKELGYNYEIWILNEKGIINNIIK